MRMFTDLTHCLQLDILQWSNFRFRCKSRQPERWQLRSPRLGLLSFNRLHRRILRLLRQSLHCTFIKLKLPLRPSVLVLSDVADFLGDTVRRSTSTDVEHQTSFKVSEDTGSSISFCLKDLVGFYFGVCGDGGLVGFDDGFLGYETRQYTLLAIQVSFLARNSVLSSLQAQIT